jgi:hypothetical protein
MPAQAIKYSKESLLVNWVTFPPVGHAVEAFKVANAWSRRTDLEISVALNHKSAVELAQCLDWVKRVYPIDLNEFENEGMPSATLNAIPRRWNYVFTDPRIRPNSDWPALNHFHDAFRKHVQAAHVNTGNDSHGFPTPKATPLKLVLPERSKNFAHDFINADASIRISLLFGTGTGSGCRNPPLPFWQELIRSLIRHFGDIEIILIGALGVERTHTLNVNAEELRLIESTFPQVRNAFDLGLLNQLAIAELCNLHISPHTGMSTAIQCVGTPWLVLSGGEYWEYVFNGVPFVCIYPNCPRYPCTNLPNAEEREMLPDCHTAIETGATYLCMKDHELTSRIPEILDAAARLINKQPSYFKAINEHYQYLLDRIGEPEPGSALLHDWPDVLTEDFRFEGAL